MRKKRKIKQKKLKLSAVKVFLLTFSIVILAGASGMGGFLLFSKERAQETFSESAEQKEKSGFRFFWEDIPEQEEQQKDTTQYGELLANPEYMKENKIYEKTSRQEGIVTLGFAGDILFDDEYAVMANLMRRGITIENGISEAALSQMQGVDIMMVNNEFAFTDRGTRTEGKTYTFRADTQSVSYLHDMGVDVVSIANNHVYDYGETGLLDTLDTLSKANIPYVGAGRNFEEAVAPVYFISGDLKIAIVSATQIERLDHPDTKGADEETPGVFRCWDPEKLYEVVAQAKENSDFVIVYIHWGTENESEPDWAQVKQAPEIAKAGADLIIGDHPHCLQGIQFFGKTPVIYSLGNFWFNSKTVDTGILQVDISNEGLEAFRFIPALQDDSKTDLAYGTDKERILSHMRMLSPGIQIDEEGYVNLQN